MLIHIIRHADPDYVNDTITPRGHREAEALAERLGRERLDRIYSSPMGRAIATVSYTEKVTGLSATVLPWTSELSMAPVEVIGEEPRVVWNVPGQIVRGGPSLPTHADWDQLPELSHYAYRGRQEELTVASDAFLASEGYRRRGHVYESNAPERSIAIFCHAGFAMSWLAHLLGLPPTLVWTGFFLAPSSVTTVLMERRGSRIAVPRALTVGDTSHIYARGLTPNHRGVLADDFNQAGPAQPVTAFSGDYAEHASNGMIARDEKTALETSGGLRASPLGYSRRTDEG